MPLVNLLSITMPAKSLKEKNPTDLAHTTEPDGTACQMTVSQAVISYIR